nr:hypothetical protein [Tanacetum cinerariifolium]
MQGTSLTKQERECKLYDEFDKFAYKKGETLRDFYLRFSLLLNDLNIYNVKLEHFHVNTMFLNSLPPEWSKFMTDVKLVWDLHTTNIDQLHAYLEQHEFHENEVRVMHEPEEFVKPRKQATINDRRLTLQLVHRRKISFAMSTSTTYTPATSGSNSGKQRTVICYNCKGEGHMSKQCTKPKRKHDDSWFKDKVLLVQAQVNGQILHEEELAFLADPGIPEVALMENLSHYGLDALAESNVMNQSETEITSDSNIIPYSQYVIESQQAVVHNSKTSAQQDALILSVIEQLKTQLEPKLYDGNIIKNTCAIVIPDSEETLMLAEESHPNLSNRPTTVEVPKELPKVSMVHTSFKKLKHHLAGFDVVVKERTTPTTITEGSWGFEHTKAYFRDDIIPFLKALKDIFNTFDQYLIDELAEVQNVFHQMEQAVEQHLLELKTFEVKMNQVLNENERFLEQVINKDIVNIVVNSSVDNASEQGLIIAALRDELRKLKGKAIVDTMVSTSRNS